MSNGYCWCGRVEWFVGTDLCRDHITLQDEDVLEPVHATPVHEDADEQPEDE